MNQKKLNVKTLPLDGTNWAFQSYTPLKLPSGRAEVTTAGTFLPTLSKIHLVFHFAYYTLFLPPVHMSRQFLPFFSRS